MSIPKNNAERKALGAFYTDRSVADFLVAWTLRQKCTSVMDPSCGDGRFLESAAQAGTKRIVGCDLNDAAIQATRDRFRGANTEVELYSSDFFALEPHSIEPVDAVVGNPPFVRYQRFTGESRKLALESAMSLGVYLTRLTSSWAPFLLHAIRFIRPGGALAMVVPGEILSAQYGLTTLRALLRHFGSVGLLAFEQNLFADAQEEVCLLMATIRGSSCDEVRLLPLESARDLPELGHQGQHSGTVCVELPENTVVRFAEAFLGSSERSAWRKIQRQSSVFSLASLATVTNGYVTGDNAFFHRSKTTSKEKKFPPTWFFPTTRSSKSLRSLFYTSKDIEYLETKGVPHHLVIPQDDLFDSDGKALTRFVTEGELLGVHERFKCRKRKPWWKVPGIQRPDILVSYMAGAFPRAAVNRAGALHTNSMHGLHLRTKAQTELIALSLYSSLTLLSLEIEGRSYGGGILKLEPRELDRVLVACPVLSPTRTRNLAAKVDGMLRAGRYDLAVEAVDRTLLLDAMGMPRSLVEELRNGRERLLNRRSGRAQGKASGISSRSRTRNRERRKCTSP